MDSWLKLLELGKKTWDSVKGKWSHWFGDEPEGEVRDYRLRSFRSDDQGTYKTLRLDGFHSTLLNRIRQSRHPIVVVRGRAGSGKTSIIRSHVIPTLQRDKWECLYLDNCVGGVAEITRALGLTTGGKRITPKDAVEHVLDRTQKAGKLAIILDHLEYIDMPCLRDEWRKKDIEDFLRRVRGHKFRDGSGTLRIVVVAGTRALDQEFDSVAAAPNGDTEEFVPYFEQNQVKAFLSRPGRAIGLVNQAATVRYLAEISGDDPRVQPGAINALCWARQKMQGVRKARALDHREMIVAAIAEEIKHRGFAYSPARSVLSTVMDQYHRGEPIDGARVAADTGIPGNQVEAMLRQFHLIGLVRLIDVHDPAAIAEQDGPPPRRRLWQIRHSFLAPHIRDYVDGKHIAGAKTKNRFVLLGSLSCFVGVALVWVSWRHYQDHVAHVAKEHAFASLGFKRCDWNFRANLSKEPQRWALAPGWLRWLFNIENKHPVLLEIMATHADEDAAKGLLLSDDDWKHVVLLNSRTPVCALHLNGSRISHLPSLDQFTFLERLDIQGTAITRLDGIEKLGRLQWLDWSDPVSGFEESSSLSALSELPNLRYLLLRGRQFPTGGHVLHPTPHPERMKLIDLRWSNGLIGDEARWDSVMWLGANAILGRILERNADTMGDARLILPLDGALPAGRSAIDQEKVWSAANAKYRNGRPSAEYRHGGVGGPVENTDAEANDD